MRRYQKNNLASRSFEGDVVIRREVAAGLQSPLCRILGNFLDIRSVLLFRQRHEILRRLHDDTRFVGEDISEALLLEVVGGASAMA